MPVLYAATVCRNEDPDNLAAAASAAARECEAARGRLALYEVSPHGSDDSYLVREWSGGEAAAPAVLSAIRDAFALGCVFLKLQVSTH
jgi:hypothetical protein